jgi:hypothetical protein
LVLASLDVDLTSFIDESILESITKTSIKTTGKDIKKHNLGKLIKPENAKKEFMKNVNMCKDNKYYFLPINNYIGLDIDEKIYDRCISEDIKTINNKDDLLNLKPDFYIYAILPDETIKIIERENNNKNELNTHTMLTCGGPVISAGEMLFYDKKIVQINIGSGHYKPDLKSLVEAMDIFDKKKMITKKDFLPQYFNISNNLQYKLPSFETI